MKRVAVVGATGSVAGSALAVARFLGDRFRIVALSAGSGGDAFLALAEEFPDALLALADPADGVRERLSGRRLFLGPDANGELLAEAEADVVVLAAPGTAGLGAAFAAARPGVRLLLANKEVLVSAGKLFLAHARRNNAEVLPLDSEHCALHQCLDGRDPASVERLVVTASGGPFRSWDRERIARAAPADALNHPIWRMGPKITVDSATLANKALEVVEAHHLFSMPLARVDVLVHPQSAIHGLVEFKDGSWLAHIGRADMRLAAQYAFLYPDMDKSRLPRLNPLEIRQLTFEEPRLDLFPLLGMGIAAAGAGDRRAACFNAANERAVTLFLDGKLDFYGMAEAVRRALDESPGGDFSTLAEVFAAHDQAVAAVGRFVAARKKANIL
ncbi:MAG: 1-deoxy-D-xylulose-5-phosphate reductoisomerase [Planctomycetota bacterium]|jgi:1-deoxy-D-xylulose-5-phosphate reductoisomerase|nr:1-deoxy-D-xylulose-5-phosphate reductoisomerase [Planctomycetota bacterium]